MAERAERKKGLYQHGFGIPKIFVCFYGTAKGTGYNMDSMNIHSMKWRLEKKGSLGFMVYDTFKTGYIGVLTLAGDEKGLRYIAFEKSPKIVRMKYNGRRDPDFFKNAKDQLKAYFNHELKKFHLPIALEGTPFQRAVWKTLQRIPYGTVTTYQWVATQIGNPKAVRAVGGAIGKNPIAVVIPCHRVIGSDGSLTGFGGGLDVKQRLIDLEKQTVGRYIS